VFQGTGDGDFSAYDARNGNRLWSFDARQGIIASPISYTVNAVQYISVLAGYGGAIAPMSDLANRGWKFRSPRRLLTFALDANGRLPSSPPRDLTVTALDDPTLQIDPLRARSGRAIYQGNCAYCHGRFLVSPGGPAPDLRESPIALNWSSFLAVVKDGALLNQLMPRFQELPDHQLRDVYLYIRSGSRQILQAQKAPK
jgi:quinohemoprotein ethanol dehydrogenase